MHARLGQGAAQIPPPRGISYTLTHGLFRIIRMIITSRNPVLRTVLLIMYPDLNFTRPIFPSIPLLHFSIVLAPCSSSLPSLFTPRVSPLLQTLPHSSSLILTCPPSFLLVPAFSHFCLLFITPNYSS